MVQKRYTDRKPVYFHTEGSILEQFKEVCYRERKDVAEKLNELMRTEIQKNVSPRLRTPINITFSNDINQSGKKDDITSLDYFIEKKHITSDYWHDYFSKKDSYDEVMRYEALSLTIHNQAKQRRHFLKTGRYLVQ